MSISVTCSACGQKLKVADAAAGKRGKCPKCGGLVQIPDSEMPCEVVEPIPLRRAEPAVVQRVYAAPITAAPAPVATAPPPVPTVNVKLPRRGSSLGIAACILGILAFLICWVPLIGLVGVPLSALGLLLGIIGLLVAFFRKGAGIGFPIAGSAISGLALFVAIGSTLATGKALEAGAKSMQAALNEGQRTNQEVIPAAGPKAANRTATPQARQPRNTPPAAPPGRAAEPEEQWASATDAVKQGDITVRITAVKSGKVALKSGFGDSESESVDALLAIEVLITNTGANKKVEYHTFMGRDFSIGRDYASLHDNFDNTYKRIGFGMSKPVGANESESIYPGKSITDVLVFEIPIDTAEYLKLELPAQSFGGTGLLRFRIPASMIQKR